MICEQTQINLNSEIYKPGYSSPTMVKNNYYGHYFSDMFINVQQK
jgi:hypothetical protein